MTKVHEMIIISLFDEVEFDDRGGGGYLDDESAIRREKRFLGSVVLPFQVKNPPPERFQTRKEKPNASMTPPGHQRTCIYFPI